MILDDFISIKWHSRNKNYYINKGYVFTKVGDLFCIKINDLFVGSKTIVRVKCDICGNEKYLTYQRYNKNILVK